MMSNVVLYEKQTDGVVVITLNRPEKRNAVSPEVAAALDAAVKQSESDSDIRVVILASSNDQVFCAGADLAAVAEGRGALISTPDGGFAGFVAARRRKPWIAAVRGAALAGGFELCLACDMIIAAHDSRFGLPEVKRGLMAAAGGLSRLPRAIPRHIALEMVATGDPIDAPRAYALGLISQMAKPDDVFTEALALARRIAVNAPLAVQESVTLARDAAYLDEAEAELATNAAMGRLRMTEDFREGPRAFLEKRAPMWTGR